MLQPLGSVAVVLGRLAAQDAIGDRGLQRGARFADDDEPPALLAQVRVDAGILQQVEQILQGVVVDVVALKVDARHAQARFGRQLVVVSAAQGFEQQPSGEIGTADAEDDDAVGCSRKRLPWTST